MTTSLQQNKKKLILLTVSIILIIVSIPIAGFVILQLVNPQDSNEDPISNIKIAIYNGPGVMEGAETILTRFSEWSGFEYVVIDGYDVRNDALLDVDVVIMPGGDGIPYEQGLGSRGRAKIVDFVENGGGYIGICQGAYIACEYNVWMDVVGSPENNLGVFPAAAWGPILEIAERPEPGWGMATIDILNTSHPIVESAPETMTMYYQGGCYLEPTDNSSIAVLALYNANGKIAIATCEYGQGRVFISGPHPELEEDNDRDGVDYPDPDAGPYDPESDWPLLRDAVK
jgi:glutamine amidotransferase-like uncharacterized protein